MTIQYITKPKPSDYENETFTFGKEYKVLADYRKRQSGQRVADDGLVIKNDKNEIEMVFLNNFKIICNDTTGTFVFNH